MSEQGNITVPEGSTTARSMLPHLDGTQEATSSTTLSVTTISETTIPTIDVTTISETTFSTSYSTVPRTSTTLPRSSTSTTNPATSTTNNLDFLTRSTTMSDTTEPTTQAETTAQETTMRGTTAQAGTTSGVVPTTLTTAQGSSTTAANNIYFLQLQQQTVTPTIMFMGGNKFTNDLYFIDRNTGIIYKQASGANTQTIFYNKDNIFAEGGQPYKQIISATFDSQNMYIVNMRTPILYILSLTGSPDQTPIGKPTIDTFGLFSVAFSAGTYYIATTLENSIYSTTDPLNGTWTLLPNVTINLTLYWQYLFGDTAGNIYYNDNTGIYKYSNGVQTRLLQYRGGHICLDSSYTNIFHYTYENNSYLLNKTNIATGESIIIYISQPEILNNSAQLYVSDTTLFISSFSSNNIYTSNLDSLTIYVPTTSTTAPITTSTTTTTTTAPPTTTTAATTTTTTAAPTTSTTAATTTTTTAATTTTTRATTTTTQSVDEPDTTAQDTTAQDTTAEPPSSSTYTTDYTTESTTEYTTENTTESTTEQPNGSTTRRPPTTSTTKPGSSTTTPGGSTTTPGGSTTAPPGGSTTTPGGSTTTPGGSTTTPGGSTTAPGGSTTTPGGSTTAPGGSTTTPGGSTTAPGGSTTTPGGSTTAPSTSTTTPIPQPLQFQQRNVTISIQSIGVNQFTGDLYFIDRSGFIFKQAFGTTTEVIFYNKDNTFAENVNSGYYTLALAFDSQNMYLVKSKNPQLYVLSLSGPPTQTPTQSNPLIDLGLYSVVFGAGVYYIATSTENSIYSTTNPLSGPWTLLPNVTITLNGTFQYLFCDASGKLYFNDYNGIYRYSNGAQTQLVTKTGIVFFSLDDYNNVWYIDSALKLRKYNISNTLDLIVDIAQPEIINLNTYTAIYNSSLYVAIYNTSSIYTSIIDTSTISTSTTTATTAGPPTSTTTSPIPPTLQFQQRTVTPTILFLAINRFTGDLYLIDKNTGIIYKQPFGTESEVIFYNKDDTFKERVTPSRTIFSVTFDSQNMYLVNVYTTFLYVLSLTGLPDQTPTQLNTVPYALYSVAFSQGVYYIATTENNLIYSTSNPVTGPWTLLPNVTITTSLGPPYVFCDEPGILYYNDNNGIYKYSNGIQTSLIISPVIKYFYIDNSNNIWYLDSSGILHKYSISTSVDTIINVDRPEINNINAYPILAIYNTTLYISIPNTNNVYISNVDTLITSTTTTTAPPTSTTAPPIPNTLQFQQKTVTPIIQFLTINRFTGDLYLIDTLTGLIYKQPFGTNSEVVFYNKDDTFKEGAFPFKLISSVTFDSQNMYLVNGYTPSLYVLSLTGLPNQTPTQLNPVDYNLYSVAFSQGVYYIATFENNSIYSTSNPLTGPWTLLPNVTITTSLTRPYIFVDEPGILYYNDNTGIYKYGNGIQTTLIISSRIKYFYLDNSNNIWYLDSSGILHRYNISTSVDTIINVDQPDINNVNAKPILAIYNSILYITIPNTNNVYISNLDTLTISTSTSTTAAPSTTESTTTTTAPPTTTTTAPPTSTTLAQTTQPNYTAEILNVINSAPTPTAQTFSDLAAILSSTLSGSPTAIAVTSSRFNNYYIGIGVTTYYPDFNSTQSISFLPASKQSNNSYISYIPMPFDINTVIALPLNVDGVIYVPFNGVYYSIERKTNLSNKVSLTIQNNVNPLNVPDPSTTTTAVPANVKNYGDFFEIGPNWYKFLIAGSFPLIIGSIAPCLLKGSRVLTPNGYKYIEDLSEQSFIITHKGETLPIKKYSKQVIQWCDSLPQDKQVYKIAGARPIYLTAWHKIQRPGGKMVEAMNCLPKASKEEYCVNGVFEIYHIHVANWYRNHLVIDNGRMSGQIVESWSGKFDTSKNPQ